MQHMSHEQDQVSNLLGMVAGMAKDEKTRQALLRRQARVETHAESDGSNQLLADAASLGASVSVASSVTATASTMSEEERREREAVRWHDTGVAGTWHSRLADTSDAVEPKPKGRWDSSVFDAIGKTASALGVVSAETTTTVAPPKRDSLVAAFMRHSKDVQLHLVDSTKAASGMDKDADLFTDQDAQDAAQERASQEHDAAHVAHEAEVQAMYDATELRTRATPPSGFMAARKRTAEQDMKTSSALDTFTFDDPALSSEGKHVALASTGTRMSHNLASWLGYESAARPQAHVQAPPKKTNDNWYLVDLGLENSQ